MVKLEQERAGLVERGFLAVLAGGSVEDAMKEAGKEIGFRLSRSELARLERDVRAATER